MTDLEFPAIEKVRENINAVKKHWIKATAHFICGDIASEEKENLKALKLDSFSYHAKPHVLMFALPFDLVKKRDYLELINKYQAQIQLNPNDFEKLFYLSRAQFLIEDWESALTSINKAISLYTRKSDIFEGKEDDYCDEFFIDQECEYYWYRALIKTELLDFDGAIDDYNQMLKIDPADSYNAKSGRLEALKEKQPKVLLKLKKKLSRYYKNIRFFVSSQLHKLDQWADKEKVSYVIEYGKKINFRSGDHQAAIAAFTKAIEINPTLDYYYHRANLKFDMDDTKGGENDLYKALQIDPDQCKGDVPYFYQGLIRFTLKDYSKAIESFTIAMYKDQKLYDSYKLRENIIILLKDLENPSVLLDSGKTKYGN